MLSALPFLLMLATGFANEPSSSAITVGAPALAFSLPALNEQAAINLVRQANVSLGELVGIQPAHPAKGVVLYFFDRTNGGEGLRPLNGLVRRFRSDNVAFLGICTDRDEEIGAWIEGLKLDYPVLRDNFHIVSGRYQMREAPMVVVVDADGMIFSAGNPAMMELEANVEAEVNGLLGHGD